MSQQLASALSTAQLAQDRAKAAEDRAEALTAKVEALSSAVARADQRQEGLDRALRRDRMMFFGMSEAHGLTAEEQVHEHLRAVGCTAATKITEAVRLGPARASSGPSAARPRPVRVTFASQAVVHEVFKVCRALREQRKVFVDRDLSVQQQAVRTSLMGDCKQLRENGFRPFWRAEKLFYASEPGSRAKEFRSGDSLPVRPRGGASPGRSA